MTRHLSRDEHVRLIELRETQYREAALAGDDHRARSIADEITHAQRNVRADIDAEIERTERAALGKAMTGTFSDADGDYLRDLYAERGSIEAAWSRQRRERNHTGHAQGKIGD